MIPASAAIAETAQSHAPAPKTGTHWNAHQLPTATQLISPDQPALAGAGRSVLDAAISAYTTAIYKDLHRSLDKAIAALHEPPKPKDPSFANKVVGFLVKQVTELVLMYVGGGIINAAKGVLGEAGAQALKGVALFGAKAGGEAAGDAVKEKPPGASRYVPSTSTLLPTDPSAKTLVDEFAARQAHALDAREADTTVIEAMIAAIPNADDGKLLELAQSLRSAAVADSQIGAIFMQQVTYGWMNLCASLALGERKPGEPEFRGAGTVGGIRGELQKGNSEFAGGQDGFINIELDVPDQIWGTNGLRLASMTTANTSAGADRILRNMNTPILATPLYRRIWLGKSGQGLLGWDPVMIISPDGTLSVDVDQPLLAAIGRLVPVSFERAGALPEGERNFARDARLGATMVMSWLGQIKTEKLL